MERKMEKKDGKKSENGVETADKATKKSEKMLFEKNKARLSRLEDQGEKYIFLKWKDAKLDLRGDSQAQASEKLVLTLLGNKCGIVFEGMSIPMIEGSSIRQIKFIK